MLEDSLDKVQLLGMEQVASGFENVVYWTNSLVLSGEIALPTITLDYFPGICNLEWHAWDYAHLHQMYSKV